MTVLEVKHQGKLREWQERIIECRSSGKPVKAWCQEQGVSAAAYYRWEREIFGRAGQGKDGVIAGTPEFAEVRAMQTAYTSGTQPMITVRAGALAADIYPDADKEMIQIVVQTLRLC